jgi:hypothetical protein
VAEAALIPMRPVRPYLSIALVAASLSLSALPEARAQQAASGDAAKSMVGDWEMSNADRDRKCTVSLKPTAQGPGFAVVFDSKCGALFPFSKQVTAWRVGDRGALQFIDANAQTLLEVSDVEGGLLQGERPGEGLLFLQTLAGAALDERKPEQFVGDWTIVSGSKAICRLTLTTTPAPGADTLLLRLKPGCGAAVARFNPVAWQFDLGQLVLHPANGNPWRFEEGDQGAWRRIPETRPAMQLVRQP